jgi:hypothetical protein
MTARQAKREDSPEVYAQTPPYKWWNWHDQYAPLDQGWVKMIENAKETLNLRLGRTTALHDQNPSLTELVKDGFRSAVRFL